MPEPLPLLPPTVLRGERMVVREHRESDIDDPLAHRIDQEEADCYGSHWRRTLCQPPAWPTVCQVVDLAERRARDDATRR